METKGGKKKSSSNSLFYEAPLGYSIEDIRPNGGIKKFRSAAYSNVSIYLRIVNQFDVLLSYYFEMFKLKIYYSFLCSALASRPDIL